MRRRSDPSKGEHYQWESFPPHSESDRQLARETLLRLQELHPAMRQPRTRSGREEIVRILTEAIEEYQFPPFVRSGYEEAPDAAMDALYKAYIRLRSNLASRLMQQTSPSPPRPTRRSRRTPRLNYSLLSPEAEPSALKHEPTATLSGSQTPARVMKPSVAVPNKSRAPNNRHRQHQWRTRLLPPSWGTQSPMSLSKCGGQVASKSLGRLYLDSLLLRGYRSPTTNRFRLSMSLLNYGRSSLRWTAITRRGSRRSARSMPTDKP